MSEEHKINQSKIKHPTKIKRNESCGCLKCTIKIRSTDFHVNIVVDQLDQ